MPAPVKAGVEVIGAPEFKAKLSLIAVRLTGDEAGRVFLVAARVVRDEAKQEAPRSQYPAFSRLGRRGGSLHAGSTSQPGTLKKSIVAFRSRSKTDPAAWSRVNVFKGSVKARHGHLVHSGTKARIPKSSKRMIFLGQGGRFIAVKRVAPMPANPFFQRAIGNVGDRALDQATQAMQRLIEKDLN